MKHLKKYNESESSGSDNQDIFDDLIDCFVDLIDNDPEFDETEYLKFKHIGTGSKDTIESTPFIEKIDGDIIEIKLFIGFETRKISEDQEEEFNYRIEHFEKSAQFLKDVKIAINRFISLHKFYYEVDFKELTKRDYILINFITYKK
jgi:hypothetical protein